MCWLGYRILNGFGSLCLVLKSVWYFLVHSDQWTYVKCAEAEAARITESEWHSAVRIICMVFFCWFAFSGLVCFYLCVWVFFLCNLEQQFKSISIAKIHLMWVKFTFLSLKTVKRFKVHNVGTYIYYLATLCIHDFQAKHISLVIINFLLQTYFCLQTTIVIEPLVLAPSLNCLSTCLSTSQKYLWILLLLHFLSLSFRCFYGRLTYIKTLSLGWNFNSYFRHDQVINPLIP